MLLFLLNRLAAGVVTLVQQPPNLMAVHIMQALPWDWLAAKVVRLDQLILMYRLIFPQGAHMQRVFLHRASAAVAVMEDHQVLPAVRRVAVHLFLWRWVPMLAMAIKVVLSSPVKLVRYRHWAIHLLDCLLSQLVVAVATAVRASQVPLVATQR